MHLVGHSYGAGVVMLTALQAPERVRSLTLIEPGLRKPPARSGRAGLTAEKATRVAALSQVWALVDAEKHLEAAELFIDWVQGGDRADSRACPRVCDRGFTTTPGRWGPRLPAGSQPDVSPASLRGLRMPTLVVTGEQTRGFYRLIGEVAAAGIPAGRLAKLPGSSHMTIVEAPTGMATLLIDFLSR